MSKKCFINGIQSLKQTSLCAFRKPFKLISQFYRWSSNSEHICHLNCFFSLTWTNYCFVPIPKHKHVGVILDSLKTVSCTINENGGYHNHCGELWRTVWVGGLGKLNKATVWPRNPTAFERKKTLCDRGICVSTFILAFLAIVKTRNQLQCLSVHEWIQKMW